MHQIGRVVFFDPAPPAIDAGAVEKVGDRAQGAFGLVEQAHDVGLARHVTWKGNGLAAFADDLRHDRLGLCLARAVVDGDPVAPRGGPAGGFGADARSAAGDQQDLGLR